MTRKRLPDTRHGLVHKVIFGGIEWFITTGEYDDGTLGEIFIKIAKEGDEMRLYDIVAISISLGIQHGIPLQVFVDKFKHMKLEPRGWTNNPNIPKADSIVDYLVKWLEMKYLSRTAPSDPTTN